MIRTTSTDKSRAGERGSATIEAVMLLPVFMLFVLLIIVAGRYAIAQQVVQAAAAEAARTASIARTQGEAARDARAAAARSFTERGLRCTSQHISVDTTGFAAPVGTPAAVTATVACAVETGDLALPGLPGHRTLAASVTSPIDTYRER